MNGTGLFFTAILIVVLIAVAFGSSQIQADLTNQIAAITGQRDTTLQLAEEARAQRDSAFQARDAAQAERDTALANLEQANGRIAALEAEKNQMAQTLGDSQRQAEALRQEIDSLRGEMKSLQARLDQAQNAGNFVPVTGDQSADSQSPAETGKAIRHPFLAGLFINQLGIGLVLIIGMAALGSGGYVIINQFDPQGKVTVKMTREQIRDYARYRRETGKH